jgi:hypothetical protein
LIQKNPYKTESSFQEIRHAHSALDTRKDQLDLLLFDRKTIDRPTPKYQGDAFVSAKH